jgi:17beta-estradiol 17-dehydrogenase / very-long-chain 3-oxoacyl-CoA reductase
MWLIVNILGVLVLLFLLFKLLALLWRLLWPYVLARPKNLKQLAGDCRWALVTGCTDGIGRAYAQELASRGFSLVLVSRTAQKLEQMEQEFRRRFIKADFLSIPFDFSEPRVEEYRHRLLKQIQHLDIGILGLLLIQNFDGKSRYLLLSVNNVGAAHSYPQRFHDSAGGLEKTADVMASLFAFVLPRSSDFAPILLQTINMFPVTLLTAFVLDQMLKRGKGVVVNISSIAAYSPNFHTALYSATKVGV